MKKIQKQILSGTAALSMSVLQLASIAPLQAAAKSSDPVTVQSEVVPRVSETVKAVRASVLEDGKSYILAGGSATVDQILTPEITSGSKVSSVFKAASLSGLNFDDASQEIECSGSWVWKAHINEEGKVAMEDVSTGKFMHMTEGERPISLEDEPQYVNLLYADHVRVGKSMSLNLGTWYMNYSETQFGFSFYDGTKYSQDEHTNVNQLAFYAVEESETPGPDDPNPPAGDALADLLFLSDFQTGNEVSPYTSVNDVPESLRSTIRDIGQKMVDAGYIDLDAALYCGDYSAFSGRYNYDADPTYGIEALNAEVNALWGTEHETVAIQGNHDLTNYPYDHGAIEYDNFVVYAINTMYRNDTDGSFPWYQGSSSDNKARVERLAQNLDTYLTEKESKGDNRPVIVMSHVPLHFSGRVSSLYGAGDNMNAGLIFDVLNTHGADQDIIFLYGHNHSNGWDSYLGGSTVFREAGDKLAIPDASKKSGNTTNYYTTEELTFTYMNAGYVGYWKDGTADNTLTATMCEIYPDRIVFNRFSKDGLHALGSTGSYNNKYADQGILSGYDISHPETASPKTILRNTGEPTLSVQAEAGTVGSSVVVNALSKNIVNPVFSWSVSDPSAFDVSENGRELSLFCRKAGSYEITLSAEDENGETYTATAALEVSASEGEAAVSLTDENGNAVSEVSKDVSDTLNLTVAASGISSIESITWSLPDFVSTEGSDIAKSLSFTKGGKGTVTVEIAAKDAQGSDVTLTSSVSVEAISLPHYTRSALADEEKAYLLISKTGAAIMPELKTAGGISTLVHSDVLENIALGNTEDQLKGAYDGMLWIIKPAASGKWTIQDKTSGKYLTMTSSSRNVTLTDTPCELEIATGTAASGGNCIAVHSGSMYLNFSSSKDGFCGYSGETITNANNQIILYAREEDAPVIPDEYDYRLLQQAVTYAHNVEIPETLNETVRAYFTQALAEAEAILENGASSQDEIDAAWRKLSDAIHMLDFTSNKAPLLALIEQAEALKESDYDAASWNALQTALNSAKEVATNPDALDLSIQKAVEELTAAIAALQPSETINTAQLELVIAASDAIDLSQYMEAGKAEFTDALAHAKAVLADPKTQSEVDEAAMSLNMAYMVLRLAPSEEMLKELADFSAYLTTLDTTDFPVVLRASIDMFQKNVSEGLENNSLSRTDAENLLNQKKNLEKQIENVLNNKPANPADPEKPESKDPIVVPEPTDKTAPADEKKTEPAADSSTSKSTGKTTSKSVKTSAAVHAGWYILAAAGAVTAAVSRRRKHH